MPSSLSFKSAAHPKKKLWPSLWALYSIFSHIKWLGSSIKKIKVTVNIYIYIYIWSHKVSEVAKIFNIVVSDFNSLYVWTHSTKKTVFLYLIYDSIYAIEKRKHKYLVQVQQFLQHLHLIWIAQLKKKKYNYHTWLLYVYLSISFSFLFSPQKAGTQENKRYVAQKSNILLLLLLQLLL